MRGNRCLSVVPSPISYCKQDPREVPWQSRSGGSVPLLSVAVTKDCASGNRQIAQLHIGGFRRIEPIKVGLRCQVILVNTTTSEFPNNWGHCFNKMEVASESDIFRGNLGFDKTTKVLIMWKSAVA